MVRRVLAVLACCLVLAACSGDDGRDADPSPSSSETSASGASDFCSGQSWQEVDVDGQQRSALVRVPQDWDGSSRLPVVYFFHGLGGQADVTLAYTGLAERADELGYIVVAPQAVLDGSRWDYRSTPEQEGSDLAFVEDLMAQAGTQECVDADRQYVTGISNGSAMAFALACDGGFPVRAYGAVAAAFYEPQCDAAPAASIVYFHGTADTVVPIEGGATPLEPVRPAAESLQRWATHSGCSSSPATDREGDDVEHLVWSSCRAPVEAYVIEGGGHTWPGAVPLPGLGETTQDVDATDVMLDFFGLAG